MKQFFLVPCILLFGIIIFVSCVHETNYNVQMDECLNAGGCWLGNTNTCELKDKQKCNAENAIQ